MLMRWTAAVLGGLLVCAGMFTGESSVGAANADIPDTETIMKKLNKKRGQVGIHPRLQPLLEAEKTDWAVIAPMAKEYVELTAALCKNPKPTKGTQASWDRQCKVYWDCAKEFEAAVSKKDKAGALAAYEKLNKTCQACHDDHR